jgi:hypothetical protein
MLLRVHTHNAGRCSLCTAAATAPEAHQICFSLPNRRCCGALSPLTKGVAAAPATRFRTTQPLPPPRLLPQTPRPPPPPAAAAAVSPAAAANTQ